MEIIALIFLIVLLRASNIGSLCLRYLICYTGLVIFVPAFAVTMFRAYKLSFNNESVMFVQGCQSGLKSGGRGPGSKNFDFLKKIPKNLDSFRQFHKKKID